MSRGIRPRLLPLFGSTALILIVLFTALNARAAEPGPAAPARRCAAALLTTVAGPTTTTTTTRTVTSGAAPAAAPGGAAGKKSRPIRSAIAARP